MITIATLQAAGLTDEQIVRVMKVEEQQEHEKLLAKREADRIRQRNHRSRTRRHSDASDTRDSCDTKTSVPMVNVGTQFGEWWALYPHKVGKRDAERSFERLIRSGKVPFAMLMDGLRRYVAKTDDRPWCNPATWLNQGRWDDQPAVVVTSRERNGTDWQSPMSAALGKLKEAEDRLRAGGEFEGGSDAAGLLPFWSGK